MTSLPTIDRLQRSMATRRRDLGLRVPALTAVYGLPALTADDQLALPMTFTSGIVQAYGPSSIDHDLRLGN